jgi:hypothetical protein
MLEYGGYDHLLHASEEEMAPADIPEWIDPGDFSHLYLFRAGISGSRASVAAG